MIKMENTISQKMSQENMLFLRRMDNNINTNTSNSPKSYSRLIQIINDYLKINNEIYLDLIEFARRQDIK